MQLNQEQGCPDFDCEDYMDDGCLVVDADSKDYLRRRLAPGQAYPEGTLLMSGPDGDMVPWDFVDPKAIEAITYGHLDLTLDEGPCPAMVLGGNACINPKRACWGELSDEQVLMIIQSRNCCLRFVGVWSNCHISQAMDDPMEMEKLANTKTLAQTDGESGEKQTTSKSAGKGS